jgi:ribonuclease BN (tRNA processing enzyme)
MSDHSLAVKIYGVRGSYPPTNGDRTEYGVNTTCLRVNIGKHVIIIDAGTGIIKLGADLFDEMNSGKGKSDFSNLYLLFTHTHIDHLMGFPYFGLLYLPQTILNVISPSQLNYSIEEILETIMSPAFFPVTIPELPCTIKYTDFAENRMIYFYEDSYKINLIQESPENTKWIGRISCLRGYTHPKGGSYIYKIENFNKQAIVFATDIEGFVGGDQRLIKFSHNAQVLIHDAQYSLPEYEVFQGFGHSTYKMACEVALKAGVNKLILSHHDPKHSDLDLKVLEEEAQKIFSETYMANEEMEFLL